MAAFTSMIMSVQGTFDCIFGESLPGCRFNFYTEPRLTSVRTILTIRYKYIELKCLREN